VATSLPRRVRRHRTTISWASLHTADTLTCSSVSEPPEDARASCHFSRPGHAASARYPWPSRVTEPTRRRATRVVPEPLNVAHFGERQLGDVPLEGVMNFSSGTVACGLGYSKSVPKRCLRRRGGVRGARAQVALGPPMCVAARPPPARRCQRRLLRQVGVRTYHLGPLRSLDRSLRRVRGTIPPPPAWARPNGASRASASWPRRGRTPPI
jgi:hypothetical protein